MRNNSLTYINDPNRKAQSNVQMHVCLSKSLTDEGHIKRVEEANIYRANGIAIRTLYFKLLTSKAVADTRGTANYLRENLTSLDSFMASVNSNIESLNLHVKEKRQGSRSEGNVRTSL